MGCETRAGLTYAVLAVVLFAWSPVLVRLAAPLSPLAISFGRLAVAGGTLFLLGLARGSNLRVSGRESLTFALYGLVLALHFLLYIASLQLTSIAHSLSLVYTAPIFTTAFSVWYLKEPISPRSYWGIALAVVGVSVLAGWEPAISARTLLGDLLALGSAICFGGYSVIGRRVRDRYELAKYAFYVYSSGALWLLPLALLVPGEPAGVQPLLAVVALGMFPLAIGHTLYNASLRRMHAARVNLIATQEVTGGILLGYLVLAESPTPQSLLGALLTMAGVAFVLCTTSSESSLQPIGPRR